MKYQIVVLIVDEDGRLAFFGYTKNYKRLPNLSRGDFIDDGLGFIVEYCRYDVKSSTMQYHVKNYSIKACANLELIGFVRFNLGEDNEKQ